MFGLSCRLLVSMAPLSNEIRPVPGSFPPHLGPAIPEISSIWFKMFLYHVTKGGPPTLLLAKGIHVVIHFYSSSLLRNLVIIIILKEPESDVFPKVS